MENTFDFTKDPLENFLSQFSEAEKTVKKDVNAMSLATVGDFSMPSVRTVLFKGLVDGGFSFFTNYQSQKSKELTANSKAGALFFWKELDQQIRIEGEVVQMARTESETYFRSRPRLSQLGAWASQQSAQLVSFNELDARMQELEKKYLGKEIPCPPHWGGFVLQPLMIEFWFGQTGRLHHRYVYERGNLFDKDWNRFLKNP